GCCGEALTQSSACWRGPYGVAGTSIAPSNAITDDAVAYLPICYIYGCSTKRGEQVNRSRMILLLQRNSKNLNHSDKDTGAHQESNLAHESPY
ncbi:hypothetical protein, partial [Burkholderia ubonensis]|uniref:hypothetical protein n=1 Tax=Burkholderia ubonensis TaxID=101571 RepID=UPI001E4EEA86